eukprot:510595_1
MAQITRLTSLCRYCGDCSKHYSEDCNRCCCCCKGIDYCLRKNPRTPFEYPSWCNFCNIKCCKRCWCQCCIDCNDYCFTSNPDSFYSCCKACYGKSCARCYFDCCRCGSPPDDSCVRRCINDCCCDSCNGCCSWCCCYCCQICYMCNNCCFGALKGICGRHCCGMEISVFPLYNLLSVAASFTSIINRIVNGRNEMLLYLLLNGACTLLATVIHFLLTYQYLIGNT